MRPSLLALAALSACSNAGPSEVADAAWPVMEGADPARTGLFEHGPAALAALSPTEVARVDDEPLAASPQSALPYGDSFFVRTDEDGWCRRAEDGARLWCADASGPPAIEGDRALLYTREGVAALDLATGDPLWSHPADRSGPSTPLVAGDRVVVGELGETWALDAGSGALQWTALRGTDTDLVVLDGLVVGAKGLNATEEASVWAVDLADGTLRWSARIDSPPWPMLQVAGRDGRLVVSLAREADLGSQLVSLEVATGAELWRRATRDEITALVLHPSAVAVAMQDQVLAFDPASGDRLWKAQLDGPALQLLGAGDGLFVLTARSLTRLAVDSGEGESLALPGPREERGIALLPDGFVLHDSEATGQDCPTDAIDLNGCGFLYRTVTTLWR